MDNSSQHPAEAKTCKKSDSEGNIIPTLKAYVAAQIPTCTVFTEFCSVTAEQALDVSCYRRRPAAKAAQTPRHWNLCCQIGRGRMAVVHTALQLGGTSGRRVFP